MHDRFAPAPDFSADVLESRKAAGRLLKNRAVSRTEKAAGRDATLPRKEARAIADDRRARVTVKAAIAVVDSHFRACRDFSAACRERREDRARKRRTWLSEARYRREKRFGRQLARIRNTELIREALEYNRRAAVALPIESAFAHGSVAVEYSGSNPVGVEVTAWKDWGVYSKGTKYPATVYRVTVHTRRYYASELPAGRREHDGLIILQADPVPSPDGECRAWKAVWLRPSRGVSWDRVTGGIVESPDGEVVHGKTVAGALANLRRRATVRQRDAMARRGICRAKALSEYGAVRMTWRHARRAGLCEDGILAWAARHFPDRDPMRDSVTVREALETRDSEPLVLSAVVRAIRIRAAA